MFKKAYITQLSFDISNEEKDQAEKAILYFDHTCKLLEIAKDHLNIMKTPFKDNPEIDTKEITKARAAIRRFRDKVVENFNEFKQEAFKCVNAMHIFASDTQTVKFMKSFIALVDELEKKVNKFVELFDNLEDKEFVSKIIESLELIQEQCDEVQETVDERILPHIQTNILANSWVNSVSNDLQMQIEQKTPLIVELFNQRQDQINDLVADK